MIYFTADTHFGHAGKKGGIIKYCNRPFQTFQEMDTVMIERWNNAVKKDDIIYHLGDFSMCSVKRTRIILEQLNGKKHLVVGDHDKAALKCKEYFEEVIGSKSMPGSILISVNQQEIFLSHYCHKTWKKSHYGSWHLYGHCFDLKTELLTKNGWKYRQDLTLDDYVLTLNIKTGFLEYNKISKIFDYPIYSGKVYSIKARGIDFRVTENHTMLDLSRMYLHYRKFPAHDLSYLSKRMFVFSGQLGNQKQIIDLSDDYLKLLVWITADGNLCNSDLIRVGLTKKRKIKRLQYLLSKLNIEHRLLPQKNNRVNVSFTLPLALRKYRLKPLDDKMRFLDRHQVKILLKEYSVTDGRKYGNTYVIYTSKPEEADIIQEVCLKNRFRCSFSLRTRNYDGINRKPSCNISVIDKEYVVLTHIKERVMVTDVNKEHFWCVATDNGTLVSRRNGKPLITGNSHGGLDLYAREEGKLLDVGVDSHGFRPISFEEVKEIMKVRPNNFNLVRRSY